VPVVTSIGDPGSDSNIPSEAAVRTAIERWVDRGDGYSVTLTDTNTDLGTHLNNILSEYGNKYKFIKITLPANTTWTWNVPVIIAKNVVCVIGQGWTNYAENLTVTINMTQNGTYEYGGTSYRVPLRLLLNGGGGFSLCGVIIQESANDSRPLDPRGFYGALFVASGIYNEESGVPVNQRFGLVQSKVYSTESVVSVASYANAVISFGHTFIYKREDSIRDIYAVTYYNGWNFATGFGIVDISHSTLDSGVSYHNDPHLYYTYTNRVLLPEYIGIGISSPSYRIHLSEDSAAKPDTNTWTVSSDRRLKANIIDADLDRCLEIVKQIPLRRFTWKDEYLPPEAARDRSKLGWIADEVESVFPKAVSIAPFVRNKMIKKTQTDETGNVHEIEEVVSETVFEDCKHMNSDQIIAAMYGAVKKLIQIVENQQKEIENLKSRLTTKEIKGV